MKASRIITVLACVVLVGSCFAQGQGGRRGRGGNSLRSLLGRADVQTELKITDDEKTKIEALPRPAGFGGRGGGNGGGGNGGGGGGARPDPAAMQARMEEERKNIQAILTPEQFTRLNELLIQREGIGAIARPEVQTSLGLSDDQKAKIKELSDKFQQANRDTNQQRRDGSLDQQAAQERNQANRNIYTEELTKVLTADQAAKLKAMGGAPFTFENGSN
jgi:hypothetical protein